MRISTAQMHQLGVAGILEQQAKLSETQQQLALGRRMLSPADDPAGATRELGLNSSMEQTRQYQRNADQATSRLELEESTLGSAGNLLQRARELAVRANNGTLDASNRAAIATEIRQLQQQLLALANTRDATGEYLFSGYQSRTEPFADDGAGNFSYNGDQGQRMAQIGPRRQIATGDAGTKVFVNVPYSGGGTQDIFSTLHDFATALEANTAGPNAITDIDAAIENITAVRADAGTRLNAIDTQREANDTFLLQMETALSEVRDLDYAEAVSRYSRQLLSLEAAQQSYARLQELSLFNFLR